MHRLGYDRFGAVGNDAGSMISPEVGRLDPEHVVGMATAAVQHQDARILAGCLRHHLNRKHGVDAAFGREREAPRGDGLGPGARARFAERLVDRWHAV